VVGAKTVAPRRYLVIALGTAADSAIPVQVPAQ
jgi:hypothetical protein